MLFTLYRITDSCGGPLWLRNVCTHWWLRWALDLGETAFHVWLFLFFCPILPICSLIDDHVSQFPFVKSFVEYIQYTIQFECTFVHVCLAYFYGKFSFVENKPSVWVKFFQFVKMLRCDCNQNWDQWHSGHALKDLQKDL